MNFPVNISITRINDQIKVGYLLPTAARFRSDKRSRKMQVTIPIKATKIDPIPVRCFSPCPREKRLTQIAQISAIAEVNTGERTAPVG